MSTLHLVIAPNPILQKISAPVSQITQEIKVLAHNMLETMYHHRGIGLSAVQVGILQRIIVVDINWVEEEKLSDEQYIMINPEIIETSSANAEYNEGCLSFPEEAVKIMRPEKITVKYLDVNGKECKIQTDGLLSTCIQHEIDHLNGTTIASRVSSLKKQLMINRIKKIKKTMEDVI